MSSSFPNVEVFEAEIRSGGPFLKARLRRFDNKGNPTDEWGSEFVWYPSWDQYDRFWEAQKSLNMT